MIRLLFALILFATAAPAGQIGMPDPPADLAEAGRDIPLAEWEGMVEGRTVWYFTDHRLWGREYYHPGAGYVTFQYWTGQCREARWSFANGIYCFDFHDIAPHCFRHVEYDGQIWVLPTNGGAPQAVVMIDQTQPDCGPAPTS